MKTSLTQIVANNTCLKSSIGNKLHYYPTFSIFLYLKNHLHVLTLFDANYCIILSVILTHSILYYMHTSPYSSLFFSPVALLTGISVPFIFFFVTHSCKIAIFTYWLLYLYPLQKNQHVDKI